MKLKISKNKKGVSPVIATVLLIALVVAATAIVYFVVLPMMRGEAELIINDTMVISADKCRYLTGNLLYRHMGDQGFLIDHLRG